MCGQEWVSPPRTRPVLYNAQDQRASIVSIVCLYAAPRCLRIFNLKHEFPYGFVVPELRVLSSHTKRKRNCLSRFFPTSTRPFLPQYHPLRRIVPYNRERIPPFTVSLNTYSPRVYDRVRGNIRRRRIPTWRQSRGQTNRWWRRTIATINHRPKPLLATPILSLRHDSRSRGRERRENFHPAENPTIIAAGITPAMRGRKENKGGEKGRGGGS